MLTALLVLALLVAVVLAGPRERLAPPGRVSLPDLPDDLDAMLARAEAAFPGIRPGLASEIVWHDPVTRQPTEWAIVYLHGFSASKQELRPVPDRLAAALGANLYFPRLSGHGLDGAALGSVRAQAWLDDTVAALAIGRRLGRRVVVMGCSTGATLATWAALHRDLASHIAALVMVSPNFAINAPGTFAMRLPWMRQVLRLLRVDRKQARPGNPAFMHAWTTRWPMTAVLPVGAVVDMVARLDPAHARQPLLVIHHPHDQVVVAGRIVAVFERWGGTPKRRIEIAEAGDPFNHVIAGDILSPGTVALASDAAIAFVRELD